MPARVRRSGISQYNTPQHRAEKARLRPIVDAGHAYCAEPRCLEPTRWIRPGTAWDLAHNRTTGGYHGAAHARCNRSEGATYGNRHRRPARRARWAL